MEFVPLLIHTLHMLRAAFALLILVPGLRADVIYQYTGAPFASISGDWMQVFGTNPTDITATINVANPFPVTGGFVGDQFAPQSFSSGGIISATISDGVRTLVPDIVYLSGTGTTITNWLIGGGFYAFQPTSDTRAIFTTNIGNGGGMGPCDCAFFTDVISAPWLPDYQVIEDAASGPPAGTWTDPPPVSVVATPEINTAALSLIAGSLLLAGSWRRFRRRHALAQK